MNLSQALVTEFESHKAHPFFVSYLVSDNNDTDSDATLNKDPQEINLNAAKELLRYQPFRFLCEAIHNKSLKDFVETYLASRSKPFRWQELSKSSATSLINLDKNVFLIFSRIATVRNDIPAIIAQMPKNSKLTVIPGGGSKKASHSDEHGDVERRLRDELCLLLANLPAFLRFPYILDLVSIMGESNSHVSSQYLKDSFAARPVLFKELSASLLETYQTVRQLSAMMQTLYRSLSGPNVTNKKSRQSSAADKKSGNKSEQAQSPEQQLDFFFAFAADIIFSICCFLDSASTILHETCLFCSQNDNMLLSKQYGANLFHMLRSVYEAALPAALKADGILHNQQLTMQRNGGAPDTIEPQKVEKSAHVNIIKLKSLKSLKVLFSVSLAITRESAALCQGSVSTRSSPEGVSWMDILQSNLDFEKEDSAVDVSMQGVFTSDFILLYGGKDVESIVRRSFGEDSNDIPGSEGEYDYILESFKVKESLLQVEHGGKVQHMGDTSTASSVPCEKASVAPTEPSLTREQSVAAIRGVVPDLGEGFVEACLDIYHGNVEQVIDAIFADNLHPALKALDRCLQKVWIGKQDREPEFLQKSGHPSAGVPASAVASSSARNITKERVRLMERKQEWDSYILSKEYDDDYDDQFDENIANRKMEDDFSDCLQSAIQDRRSENSKRNVVRPITDLDKQIAETRRLNSLIREEEQEVMFWESMRNTNRAEGNKIGSKNSWKQSVVGDEDTAEPDHSTKANHPPRQSDVPASHNLSNNGNSANNYQQRKAASNSNSTSSSKGSQNPKPKPNDSTDDATNSKSAASNGPKKQHRSKPFDSHHQKDKAFRKLGTFS